MPPVLQEYVAVVAVIRAFRDTVRVVTTCWRWLTSDSDASVDCARLRRERREDSIKLELGSLRYERTTKRDIEYRD